MIDDTFFDPSLQDDPHASMFCELKYAAKKSFHKYCFEFSRYCLTYRSNAKVSIIIFVCTGDLVDL